MELDPPGPHQSSSHDLALAARLPKTCAAPSLTAHPLNAPVQIITFFILNPHFPHFYNLGGRKDGFEPHGLQGEL